MFSEVVTVRKDIGFGTSEVHTIAVPGGYRVTGEYHTTASRGRPISGRVGGCIVAADDIDSEVERVGKLAEDEALRRVLSE